MSLSPAVAALIPQLKQAAASVGHPFPGAAVAEACLETSTVAAGWFTSAGYAQGKNLLGVKATNLWTVQDADGTWIPGPTIWLHGTEYIDVGLPAPSNMRNPVLLRQENGKNIWGGDMEWCSFPDFVSCYRLQMAIFTKSYHAPQYTPALHAATAEEYITLESAVWATGPSRGVTVNEIYAAHKDILG